MSNFRIEQDYIDSYDIVPTNQPYTYEILTRNIQDLKRAYPFLEIGSIGKSVLGKNLPYIKIGEGRRQVLYHAGIHANEWITCVLLMKFIENFCKSFTVNGTIYGKNAQKLFSEVSLYIIPMVNPDTIDLVTGNLPVNSEEYQNYQAISSNFSQIPFPTGWKANYNGVDLKNYQPVCKVLYVMIYKTLLVFIIFA